MANSAIVKLYTTVEAKLSNLEIQSGQLIFVSDTQKIYLDFQGKRIPYTTIKIFDTEKDRKSLLAPVEGFYFVEDTGILWRYKEGWIQVSPSNLEQVVIGNEASDFPESGKPGTIYTTDDAVYKWDSNNNNYFIIANKTAWQTL